MCPSAPPETPLRGVVGVAAGPEALRSLPAGLGGIEVRADLFPSPRQALALVPELARRLPVVFTLRLAAQGGRSQGPEAGRLEIFRQALRRGAALVDAELGSAAAEALAREGAPLLLSHHDFHGMPEPGEVEGLTRRLEALEPRAVKLVPTAARLEDSIRILDWIASRPPGAPPRVGFAMGEEGLPSRILSLARGAPFTYGALGPAVAPGQLEARILLGLYRADRLGPEAAVLAVASSRGAPLPPLAALLNAELGAGGLDAVSLPLAVEGLEGIERILRALRARGLCLEEPLSAAASCALVELDELAALRGAADTLVLKAAGSGRPLRGHSARDQALPLVLEGRLGPLQGLRVAVAGAGRALASTARALQGAGASPTVHAREPGEVPGLGVTARPLEALRAGEYVALVHAGGLSAPAVELPREAFAPGVIALDAAVRLGGPEGAGETAFLEAARASGAVRVPSGEVLAARIALQLRSLTGREPSRRRLERALSGGLPG